MTNDPKLVEKISNKICAHHDGVYLLTARSKEELASDLLALHACIPDLSALREVREAIGALFTAYSSQGECNITHTEGVHCDNCSPTVISKLRTKAWQKALGAQSTLDRLLGEAK